MLVKMDLKNSKCSIDFELYQLTNVNIKSIKKVISVGVRPIKGNQFLCKQTIASDR